MAYEYPTAGGVARLLRVGAPWMLDFNGNERGQWPSPDAAATAASRHQTGLAEWDHEQLWYRMTCCWRPLGDSL